MKYPKKYKEMVCEKCSKTMSIRNDYVDKHSGICMSCQKKGNSFAKKHGESKTRLYRIWNGIRFRDYKYEVTVSKEFSKFPDFRKWSMENGYKENLTIDRKNPKFGYSPKNCQWITHQENAGKDKRLFTDKQKKEIYDEWKSTKITQRQLAAKYKCSRNTILRIHKIYDIKRNSENIISAEK